MRRSEKQCSEWRALIAYTRRVRYRRGDVLFRVSQYEVQHVVNKECKDLFSMLFVFVRLAAIVTRGARRRYPWWLQQYVHKTEHTNASSLIVGNLLLHVSQVQCTAIGLLCGAQFSRFTQSLKTSTHNPQGKNCFKCERGRGTESESERGGTGGKARCCCCLCLPCC